MKLSVQLLLLIATVVVAIDCPEGQTYIYTLKKNGNNAGQESWMIKNGAAVVAEDFNFVANTDKETEFCITTPSATNQYTLTLYAAASSGWDSNSNLMIRGKDGELFFKFYLRSGTEEVFPLSLNSPVTPRSTAKYANAFTSGWSTSGFPDASWTAYTHGSGEAPSATGTQYFRYTISTEPNLAAYELALWYKAGIVVYINGNEVFRDNLAAGAVSHGTPATGSYPSVEERRIVLSGSGIAAAATVVAVEIHPESASMSTATTVDFRMRLSQFSMTNTASATENCYIIPATPNQFTPTGAVTSLDFDKGTGYLQTNLPADIRYTYTTAKYQINGAEIWPSTSPNSSPRDFSIQVSPDTSAQASFRAIASMSLTEAYTSSKSKYIVSPMVTSLSQTFRLAVDAVPGESLELFEVHPAVCNMAKPTSLTFSPSSLSGTKDVTFMMTAPTVPGDYECTISPNLPSGLFMDPMSCRVMGTPHAAVSATTYTVTSTKYPGISGTFSVSVTECNGSMVIVRRQNGGSPTYEAYEITDSNDVVIQSVPYTSGQTGNSLVTTNICFTGNDVYTITTSCLRNYWQSTSNIKIYQTIEDQEEQIVFHRFDDYLGLRSMAHFSLNRPIKSHEEWKYKMDYSSADWFSASTTGWASGAKYTYTPGTTNFQVYRKTFNPGNLANYHAFSLAISYRYGVLVYINGQELYRNNVAASGALSTLTPLRSYSALKYRYATFPLKTIPTATQASINYINSNVNNEIAIAIINHPNYPETTVSFDAQIRLMGGEDNDRTMDHTASGTSAGTINNWFNKYYTSYASSSVYTGFVDFKFNDDRREWLAFGEIHSYYSSMNYQVGSFEIEAKNEEDDSFTPIISVSGLKYWHAAQRQKFWLPNNKPYNIWRIKNMKPVTGSGSWYVNQLNWFTTSPHVGDNINYSPFSGYLNIEMAEEYPNNSEWTYNYQITPALPTGLVFDGNSGIIMGTPTAMAADQPYTITAKRLSGNQSTTVNFGVTVCTGDKGLVTFKWRVDSYGSEYRYDFFRGRGINTVPIKSRNKFPVSGQMFYFDICYPYDIYTLKTQDTYPDGWTYPAYYAATVDLGAMLVHIDHDNTGTGVYRTYEFTTYFPFQVEHSTWDVNKDFQTGTAPANWMSPDYVASSGDGWAQMKMDALGASTPVTTYIRKTFDLPLLNEYTLMNCRASYRGGLIVYFNGHRVARFNMPTTFDDTTPALTAHELGDFSQFHVLIHSFGATLTNNVMAFEHHRYAEHASTEYVGFDATGHMAVSACQIAVDSYDYISETESYSQDALLKFFDRDGYTSGSMLATTGSSFSWWVDNLDGTLVNNVWWTSSGNYKPKVTIYGMLEGTDLYVPTLASQELATKIREINFNMNSVLMMGFQKFKMVIEQSTAAVPMSEFGMGYCKSSGQMCTDETGEYPSVGNGETSPAMCQYGYTGFRSRLCTSGVFGAVDSTNCHMIPPQNLKYADFEYKLVMDIPVTIPAPSVDNLIQQYTLHQNSRLPSGMVLDELTGAISGTPIEEYTQEIVTIYARNTSGAAETELTISVRQGRCDANDAFFRTTYVGQTATYECSDQGNYIGKRTRFCKLGDKDGVWAAPSGSCTSVVGIIVGVIVGLIVLAIVVFVVIRAVKKPKVVQKAPPSSKKAASGKKPAAPAAAGVKV